MYEVARGIYMKLIPQDGELIEHAVAAGRREQAAAVTAVLDEILSRPEHRWQSAARKP